jgi:LacI family transcriptional regulator
MAKTSLKELAHLCGVSVATASRALSGDAELRIRPATRERILKAAGKLGYKPDFAARCLRSGRSRMLGVFGLDKLGLPLGVYERILAGLSDCAGNCGYELFLGLRPKNSETLPSIQLDGAALLHLAEHGSLLAVVENAAMPYVAVNCESGPKGFALRPDEKSGMRKAVECLCALGHERIAFSGLLPLHSESHISVRLRRESYLALLAERGLAPYPDYAKGLTNPAAFLRDALAEWRATAVIAYDHFVAVELVFAAAKLGLSIPKDFSLLCFNDEYPAAKLGPGLSAIAIPSLEMGRAAAKKLIEGIEAPEGLAPGEMLFEEELVLRASTTKPSHS